ncbi:MAG: 50S ribosomal protein L29 [Armatimonadetes bacterium]|nr:50S ribosomal protein L29 [Armatimonadota bacterium]
MKLKELKTKMTDMTEGELRQKLADSKEELFNLRFQLATGHLDDFSRIREVRRTIARISTFMKEREYALAAGGKGASA